MDVDIVIRYMQTERKDCMCVHGLCRYTISSVSCHASRPGLVAAIQAHQEADQRLHLIITILFVDRERRHHQSAGQQKQKKHDTVFLCMETDDQKAKEQLPRMTLI
jgi:hypothetical protein